MRNLTKTQKMYLDFIVEFEKKNGYTPLITEIAREMNKVVSTAYEAVTRLVLKGYLEKDYCDTVIRIVREEDRNVENFKKHLRKRIKDPYILKIINNY